MCEIGYFLTFFIPTIEVFQVLLIKSTFYFVYLFIKIGISICVILRNDFFLFIFKGEILFLM